MHRENTPNVHQQGKEWKSEIIVSIKINQLVTTLSIDDSQQSYVEQKKPDIKNDPPFDSIHRML